MKILELTRLGVKLEKALIYSCRLYSAISRNRYKYWNLESPAPSQG